MQLVKLVDWLMGVTSVTNIYNTLNQGQNAKYKIDFFLIMKRSTDARALFLPTNIKDYFFISYT